jgi:hypothetical protein
MLFFCARGGLLVALAKVILHGALHLFLQSPWMRLLVP